MFDDPQKLRMVLLGGSAFGLVLSVWVAAVLLWSRRRGARTQAIEQRIGLTDRSTGEGRVLRLWHDGTEATTTVPGQRQVSTGQRLRGLVDDAGWTASLGQIGVRLAAASAGVFVIAFLISRSLLPALGTGAAVVALFWIYFKQRIARRASLFERQFADALELAARSLRVGHPLVGAFQLISGEFGAPVGPLFAAICQQQNLGVPLDEALRGAAAGHTSEDLKLFATAVIIQLRSGGSLADMMERLAFVIRDRIRLTRRVRVLTAQTQFSKRILQALPLMVFVLLNMINPQYMQPLYRTDNGRMLLMVAGGCMIVGTWLMNRLAVIRY